MRCTRKSGGPGLTQGHGDPILHISSSIGIATYPEDGDDGKQLIRHADEAMHATKKTGGNRLLMASSTS
jgi:diguanylate cyclase (GGDEF)-like protein